MAIFTALTLVFFAGIINGSFALFTKHTKKWRFENIWLQYCIWTFLILPWVVAYFLSPQIFKVYEQAPPSMIVVMVVGGLIFGVGQIGFALAIDMIGIGLAFVINLGLSIMLGFLLPLVIQHPEYVLTPFGMVTLGGCLLAIIGLMICNKAGNLRDKAKRLAKQSNGEQYRAIYGIGVILAIVAGLSSAGQNFSFSYTSQMQQFATHLGTHHVGAATIMWPGFLFFGSIPYIIYMLSLHVRNKSFVNFRAQGTGIYYLFALFMGIFYYASVILYSKASALVGTLGPLVVWPLFMALIILASNFWGWRSGEWTGCSAKVKKTLWFGLVFLILSVIVLGYSSIVHT